MWHAAKGTFELKIGYDGRALPLHSAYWVLPCLH